ncbi:MAG: CvpA family protein [Candidatus Aenigmatarchaeota archaeon]
MEIIKYLNFIDLLLIFLFFRIIYIALLKGVIKELVKLISVLISSLIAFHYYSFFSKKFENIFSFLNLKYFNFISFILLFLGINLTISLISKILFVFLKQHTPSPEEKFFSFCIGCVRFAMLSSIFIFCFSLANNYVLKSFSSRLFKNLASGFYIVSLNTYNKISGKQLELNLEVKKYYETKNNLSGSNKKGN